MGLRRIADQFEPVKENELANMGYNQTSEWTQNVSMVLNRNSLLPLSGPSNMAFIKETIKFIQDESQEATSAYPAETPYAAGL